MFVLLDLHGAPGTQAQQSNTGCYTSGVYWDTDWNKTWTKNAIIALANICKANTTSCYGVELLNEPDWSISRDSLVRFYQDAIKASRDAGLRKHTPMVIMEWMPNWKYFDGKWAQFFPESTYGATNFDTHIYDFKNTVAEEEAAWEKS